MRRSRVLTAAFVAIALAAVGTPVMSHDDDHHGRGKRRLKADLRGFNEVPSVSSTARGSFRAKLNREETEIEYSLDYQGLVGTVTQAHIHFGNHHVNGGISVWLCQSATNAPATGPAAPLCGLPGGSGPEAEGVLSAANVIGPTGQGISAGEFAELVRAIKAGATYANVHSSTFPGGEVRGQIKVDD